MKYSILLLEQQLMRLQNAYDVFVKNGSVKKWSSQVKQNVKLRKELKQAISILKEVE